MEYLNIVGLVGSALLILTYFLSQKNLIARYSICYPIFKLVGSFCIVVSLLNTFNLGALLLQGMWLGVHSIEFAKYLYTELRFK